VSLCKKNESAMSQSFLSAASHRKIDSRRLSSGTGRRDSQGPLPTLGASASAPGFLSLPVVDGETLTYERFLREFALPRQPCIIRNLGSQWGANRWNATYFMQHEGVDKDYRVYMAAGPPETAREKKTTVGQALTTIERTSHDAERSVPNEAACPFYLSAWDYVRGNSTALQNDFSVPRFFERAPTWLSSNVVLGNAHTDMKWIYIGNRGSGSATHIDTNLTSAWLWVAEGEKEWVCAHGDDYELLTAGTGSRAYGYKDDDDEGSAPLPDLFAADLFERWPHARRARLFRGTQHAGDVCFNPSRCVHAVRNVGDSGDVVTSLTHNFVDATNLADVLSDATRSIRDELLPMAHSLKPKSVLKTLAKSLKISQESLVQTLLQLPELVSDARLEEVIACAAAGAEGDTLSCGDMCAGPEEVATLLRAELEQRLSSVRPAFEAAATELRTALQL
jgi:hypothetical protein